jgi:hypothetical protein
MTIRYLDISPNIKEEIEPIIGKWRHILPDWCRTLDIREGNDGNANASFSIMPEYRKATLFVHPSALTTGRLESIILHEFCHAYTTPVAMVARQYLEDSDIPATEQGLLRRRITDYEEACTEDLKDLIWMLK